MHVYMLGNISGIILGTYFSRMMEFIGFFHCTILVFCLLISSSRGLFLALGRAAREKWPFLFVWIGWVLIKMELTQK